MLGDCVLYPCAHLPKKGNMLSYQHGYHAGGYADVVKHLTLTCLLDYLLQKEKPLLYLETHAGRGLYDLKDKQALKTLEAEQGIERLWTQRHQLPPIFSSYLSAIESLNPDKTMRYYPGSPWLALHTLRPQDRVSFSELHPREFGHLQQLAAPRKGILFNNSDGLLQLKALLPPPERRGLIFLDPSYEIKTEYRQLPDALSLAYRRFETGVYCLWYPIIDKKLHAKLLRGMADIGAKNNLRIEFSLTSSSNTGMTGCGLWIMNPPYLLATQMKEGLDALRKIFNPGVSSYLIE